MILMNYLKVASFEKTRVIHFKCGMMYVLGARYFCLEYYLFNSYQYRMSVLLKYTLSFDYSLLVYIYFTKIRGCRVAITINAENNPESWRMEEMKAHHCCFRTF